MTHPSDIAGLSERLRAVCKQIAPHIGKNWLATIDEAVTALDSLRAENASLRLHLDNFCSVVSGIEDALDCAPDSVVILDAIEQLKQQRAIRRLASGPEGGSEGEK